MIQSIQMLLCCLLMATTLVADEYRRQSHCRFTSDNGLHFAVVERIPNDGADAYVGNTGPTRITIGAVGSKGAIRPAKCEITRFSMNVDGEFTINEKLWKRMRMRDDDTVTGVVTQDIFPTRVLVSDGGDGIVTITENMDDNKSMSTQLVQYNASGQIESTTTLRDNSCSDSFIVDCTYSSSTDHVIFLLCNDLESSRSYYLIVLESHTLARVDPNSAHLSILVRRARSSNNQECMIASIKGPIYAEEAALQSIVLDGEHFDSFSALSVLSMTSQGNLNVPEEYVTQLRLWATYFLPLNRDDKQLLQFIRENLDAKGRR